MILGTNCMKLYLTQSKMMIICSKEKKTKQKKTKQKKTLWVNKHHDVASHLDSFDVF